LLSALFLGDYQYISSLHSSYLFSPYSQYVRNKNGGKKMNDYLVLVKLNPAKILETLSAIRSIPDAPIDGVDVAYSMNIFGTWDVGMWINAESSNQAVDFVQKKVKDLNGVTEVYTVPTFPHGNSSKNGKAKSTEDQKTAIRG